MTNIDIRTLAFTIGLLYLILPAFTWVVLAGQRSRLVSLWCIGGLLIGLSVPLLILRGKIPDVFSITLCASMVVAGLLTRIQSLHLDLSIHWPRWTTPVVVIIYFALLESLNRAFSTFPLYAVLTIISYSGLSLRIVVLTWRLGKVHGSRSCRWIAGIYLLLAISYLLRLYELTVLRLPNEIFTPTPGVVLSGIMPILAAVIGHLGYIGYWLDRSHRREVEDQIQLQQALHNRNLIDQISHLERQRSLGEMAWSFGHELSQPLNAIKSYAQLGLEISTPSKDKKINELFVKINLNTQRAGDLIERIRNYIRPSPQQLQRLNMNQVVEEGCELLSAEMQRNEILLKLKLATDPVWVQGDKIQLSQIVVNLLRNAIDASVSPASRTIDVESCAEDGFSIVRIQDRGPGFSENILKNPGCPFVTTKHDGLGLGLSIAKGIAQQHGGSIAFENLGGGGAMAVLRLSIKPC